MTDIALNEKHRVTSDGIQWTLQRRQAKGDWSTAAYCHTKAGLLGVVEERLCKRHDAASALREPDLPAQGGGIADKRLLIDTPIFKNGKRVMDLQPGAMLALRALPEFHP